MLMLVIDPKTRPNVGPEVKHTKASKLRMIKANPLLEVRQQNAFASSSAVKPSLQHTASFKPSISFKNTIKSIDSIANDKESSGVYSTSIKRCSSARRSLSAGPPLNKSPFNEVNDAKNIRRIRSVANIQGKVFPFL
jgi:hypothetical protein